MFKGIFSPGAAVANTNLTISQNKNTNSRISASDNTIKLKSVGLWDVNVNLVATITAEGVATAQLYADGMPVEGAFASTTAGQGGTYTFSFSDVIATVPGVDEFVDLSVQLNTAGTVVGGEINVSYRS